jgi:hypothetical protein
MESQNMTTEQQIPEKFEIAIPVSEDTRKALKGGDSAVNIAKSFTIDSPEMAQVAADRRALITKQITHFEDMRKSLIAPAMQIVESARGIFNPTINGLKEAKDILGKKLTVWTQEEQKRIDEENRRREEEARKARQEAERKAAEAKAEAEARERAARKAEEEADAKRKAAEEAGNKRAAEAAARAAARAREEAANAQENAEAKSVEAQTHAAAVVEAARPEQRAKVSGFGTRENWIAEVEKGKTEQDVIKAIAANLEQRPDLIGLLSLDMKAANKLAKALKSHFSVPGLVSRNNPTPIGTRSKK